MLTCWGLFKKLSKINLTSSNYRLLICLECEFLLHWCWWLLSSLDSKLTSWRKILVRRSHPSTRATILITITVNTRLAILHTIKIARLTTITIVERFVR